MQALRHYSATRCADAGTTWRPASQVPGAVRLNSEVPKPDPAARQAAIADFLTEMLLLGLHPEPLPPQPALTDDARQALERLAGVMT